MNTPSTTPDTLRAPQADLELDIRSLRSWLARNDDDEPELILRCDEGTSEQTTVTVGFGIGGSWNEAITSAEAVAEQFLQYAEAMRRFRPTGGA